LMIVDERIEAVSKVLSIFVVLTKGKCCAILV